jgi:hypothetical protein
MRAFPRETAHEIQPPANFEGPRDLMILMLEEDSGADLSLEKRVFHQRRRIQRAVDDLARGANVFD